MTHQLTFDSVYDYGTEAIIVPVELRFADKTVRTDAYVDTGATFCVFKRELATALGIDVETGTHLRLSTVTGSFNAYGHMLTLATLELRIQRHRLFCGSRIFHAQCTGQTWLA